MITVRDAEAAEPPVVPCGSAAVGRDAKPSFGASTSRPMSGGFAAIPAPRKPMDRNPAMTRTLMADDIEIPQKCRQKHSSGGLFTGYDTGFHDSGKSRCATLAAHVHPL